MRNVDAIAAMGVAVVGELDSIVPHDPRSEGDGAHVTQ